MVPSVSAGSSSSLSLSLASGGSGGCCVVPDKALRKGPWTAAEDAVLIDFVKRNGERNWNAALKVTNLSRSGKSCRLRWTNHLRPGLKKHPFSPDEESLIIRLHTQLGNKWARIAAQLPGRTDNEIKNYWNTRNRRQHRQRDVTAAIAGTRPPLPVPTLNTSQFLAQTGSPSPVYTPPNPMELPSNQFALQSQSSSTELLEILLEQAELHAHSFHQQDKKFEFPKNPGCIWDATIGSDSSLAETGVKFESKAETWSRYKEDLYELVRSIPSPANFLNEYNYNWPGLGDNLNKPQLDIGSDSVGAEDGFWQNMQPC